jgi:U32 family peptidase
LNLKREDIELLAPVGSFESLQAAFQGNADSVYFGVGKLNMRSKSTLNFTANDLKNIVEICNKLKKKAYVTLNAIIHDEDVAEMHQVVDKCKEFGVHAIITSDLAVLKYAKSVGVEIHISTQLNISNIDAVQFFSDYADVVVLARELDLEKIKHISKNIERKKITGPSGGLVKLELFAHGALCMAISGKCYLSLHEYNRSANKGECFQICRRSYTVTDNETQAQLRIDNEYIMSPKDVCTISFLDKILNSGIEVLKIEGRARSPEYVKTVSECYDEAIKSICNKTFSREKISDWMTKLSRVYNRGFWDGYYLGRTMGEWSSVYGSVATKKKVYIGKCLNYFSQLRVAEFLVETDVIQVGDEILIIGPTTGVIETFVSEIRVNLLNEDFAKKGEKFSLPIEQTIRRSDKLYKLV